MMAMTPVLACLTVPGQPEQVARAREFVVFVLGDDHPQAGVALLLTSDSLNLTFCSSCPFWWVAASGGLMGCPGLRWWRFGG